MDWSNKPLLSVPNVADPSAASDMRTHIDRVAPVKSATDRTYADGGRGRSAVGCDFFSYKPAQESPNPQSLAPEINIFVSLRRQLPASRTDGPMPYARGPIN